MMSDWHIWVGDGNPYNLLDPANWKDRRVPPCHDARILVPAGSRIEASDMLKDFVLTGIMIQKDPKGAKAKTCIGECYEDATGSR